MKTLRKSPNLTANAVLNFKSLAGIFCCWLLSLLVVSPASAQQTGVLPEVTIVGTATTAKVNESVLKAFERSFKEAESARWYQIGKRYMVKYIANDMLHKALFRSRGGFIYDIGYGFEKDLPSNILAQVKENYENFDIKTAVNVRQSNRNIWIMNLEDDKNIIFVHAESGLLNEGEKLDKSSDQAVAYNYEQTLNRMVAAALK